MVAAKVDNRVVILTGRSSYITPLDSVESLLINHLEAFLLDSLRDLVVLVVSSSQVVRDVLHVLRTLDVLYTNTILGRVASSSLGSETIGTADSSGSIQTIPNRADQVGRVQEAVR
jgi:hypothetical protein